MWSRRVPSSMGRCRAGGCEPGVCQEANEARSDIGEVVVFDKQLVSRFHLLSDANPTEVCTPPIFMAFDVLQIGRRDVRGLPLEHRRTIDEWPLRHLGADRHT